MKILLEGVNELFDDGEVGFVYTEASSKGGADQEGFFNVF